ncbi:carbohydrate ABC transporter permease [Pelagovum pacificum]|nr:sugar ABC transporter permease [Pelagovum pacificum]QQA44462.1 sugar ABC transporter permease [Pelagovum pacificum]
MSVAGFSPKGGERVWAAALIFPTMVGLALGALGSIVATIGLSFFDWDLFTTPELVGLENYTDLPGDRRFMRALTNTLIFSAIYVPGTVILSMLIAVLLNRQIHGKSVFRLIYFLPVVSSPTAVGLVWSWIYSKDQGVLNAMVTGLGMEPVHWLGRDLALYSVVVVNIWGAIGEGMIIFLAGLQAIPKDVYEAAMLDGADRVRTFLRITMPLLIPSIFFQSILSTINAFQAFDYVYILTQTQGGGSTVPTLVFNLYREGFNNFRMGNAAAQAVVLAAMIMVLTLIYNRMQKKWG